MVESTNPYRQGTLEEEFLKLEKRVVGYDDYINCEEEHYKATLEGIDALVERIQHENVFSANEALSEVHTENLKLLMIPYYQANVLMRLMEDRDANVRKGHTYYLEYLKLMNHYHLLEKHQIQQWKSMHKDHADRTRIKDENDPEDKETAQRHAAAFQKQNEDREAKIAAYRLKKQIEANLDRLKNYADEAMKREFYKTQIEYSIHNTFDNLKVSTLELQMLEYKKNLTPDQLRADEQKSLDKSIRPLKI